MLTSSSGPLQGVLEKASDRSSVLRFGLVGMGFFSFFLFSLFSFTGIPELQFHKNSQSQVLRVSNTVDCKIH